MSRSDGRGYFAFFVLSLSLEEVLVLPWVEYLVDESFFGAEELEGLDFEIWPGTGPPFEGRWPRPFLQKARLRRVNQNGRPATIKIRAENVLELVR